MGTIVIRNTHTVSATTVFIFGSISIKTAVGENN
jgi:hypothetical protein